MKRVIATLLTEEQIRQDEGREYNNAEWQKMVTSYLKYQDVQFFKVDKDDTWEYNRYYVVYTLPEGLRLLNTFSYSSSLTNGGFISAFVSEYVIEGEKVERLPDNKRQLVTSPLYSEGKQTAINNTKEARQYMIDNCRKYGNIYTKSSIY